MMRFMLPVPPSLNNLYPTVMGRGKAAPASAGRMSRENYLGWLNGSKQATRRIKSQKYKDWIRAADNMLLTQKADFRGRMIAGKWGVMIHMPPDTADLDNRIKPILDFLVRLGLTPDDRHARHIEIRERACCVDFCLVYVGGLHEFVPELAVSGNRPSLSAE